MSATTETTTTSPTVEYKSLNRVYSIPIVADSISTIHSSLLNNTYTRTPYSVGLTVSEKAYTLSQPIQARLAPVLLRADGLANRGIDVVESRYPYPFQTPTQDIYRDLKSTTDHAVVVASKTRDDIAHDLDQKLTPLVDRYEKVLSHLGGHDTAPSSASSDTSEGSSGAAAVNAEAQSQVERAYRLTLEIRNQIYTVSSDQIKHLQAPGSVVQRVTEAVYDLNEQISNSYINAKGKGVQLRDQTQATIQTLSQTIVSELEKIQATSKSLPANIQASLQPAIDTIASTISSITSIIKSDAPVAEKATKIRETVQTQVQPIVDTTLEHVHTYVEASRSYIIRNGEKAESKIEEKTEEVKQNGTSH